MSESLSGWEFHYGGLFDSVPEDCVVHLIRSHDRRTPGATLCGRARFGIISPGGGWFPIERQRRKPWPSHVGGHPVGVCRDCMFALESGHELHAATSTPTSLGQWDAQEASFEARKILASAS